MPGDFKVADAPRNKSECDLSVRVNGRLESIYIELENSGSQDVIASCCQGVREKNAHLVFSVTPALVMAHALDKNTKVSFANESERVLASHAAHPF
jgi:hypothetical protein